LPHDPNFSDWLLKLDVQANTKSLGDPLGYGRIEYTYYQMAKDCGIEMSDCQLFEENGRGHFMTKRFDRINGEKQHIHSLCGIRHMNYENISEHSYSHLFEAARFLKLPQKEMEQLFTRMVFNVLARNCDDHTKNFSFVMDSLGKWKISPAYDLCYSYDQANVWVNGNMRINGKRNNITLLDILKEGSIQGIKNPKNIINKVFESVSAWRSLALRNSVKPELIKNIETSINENYKDFKKQK